MNATCVLGTRFCIKEYNNVSNAVSMLDTWYQRDSGDHPLTQSESQSESSDSSSSYSSGGSSSDAVSPAGTDAEPADGCVKNSSDGCVKNSSDGCVKNNSAISWNPPAPARPQLTLPASHIMRSPAIRSPAIRSSAMRDPEWINEVQQWADAQPAAATQGDVFWAPPPAHVQQGVTIATT